VVKYLARLVLKGKFDQILLHTMEPGHTFFGPDSRGGVVRRTFHKSDIYCLEDLLKMMNGLKNTSAIHIEHDSFYDWKEFLDPTFSDLHGVRDAHVVLFTRESLAMGMISMKKTSFDEDAWVDVKILNGIDWMLDVQEVPERLYDSPLQLSLKKQWSLHRLTELIPCEAFRKEFPRPEQEEECKKDKETSNDAAEGGEAVRVESFTPLRKIGKSSTALNASIANKVRSWKTKLADEERIERDIKRNQNNNEEESDTSESEDDIIPLAQAVKKRQMRSASEKKKPKKAKRESISKQNNKRIQELINSPIPIARARVSKKVWSPDS